MQNKRKNPRAKGEGGIYKRTITREDGTTFVRWEGRITLGPNKPPKNFTARTQHELLAKMDKTKREISDGIFSDTKLTVSEYLEQWLGDKRLELESSSIRHLKQNINTYIVPKIGATKLKDLSPLEVKDMLTHIAKNISGDRANKVRGVLKEACQRAVEMLLIPRNPVDATRKFKYERKEKVIWSVEDTVKFLDFARTNRLYALFYLAISAGLRPGELRSLKWSDLEGNVLSVERNLSRGENGYYVKSPKTESGKRKVTLDDETVRVLNDHRKLQDAERFRLGESWTDLGLMFAKEDGSHITYSNFQGIWSRLIKSSGVKYVSPHSKRHLNVSLRRKLGQDAKLVADQVGHKDAAFTIRQYTHLFEDDRSNAAVSLSVVLPKTKRETPN